MCTYKVGLDLVDMLVVTIWWCCTHLIECKGALCYGQAVKSWARVRRSELENILLVLKDENTSTPTSKRTNRDPLLFTVLGLSFCDFCFAPILLRKNPQSNR